MDLSHLSGGDKDLDMERREYYRRRGIDSCILRRRFICDCLEELVLPKSAPKQLISGRKPFSDSARCYLEEVRDTLADRLEELRNISSDAVLPRHLMEKLEDERIQQEVRLERKLSQLCADSKWNSVGREDLVVNLSDHSLTEVEKRALSLGLKFDIGRDRRNYVEYISKNYRHSESDVNKGFKQGVITCYKALAETDRYVIPRRYLEALRNLRDCEDIIITQADKGGGVIVMNASDYKEKMMVLINDRTTYEEKPRGFVEKEAQEFKVKARRILNSTKRGKELLHLLEEAPRPPVMKGLPKVHKPGVPMRPITSGIGSAPHRLAKCLARPLSRTLGSISDAHLKNSTDLIQRLKGVNFNGKKLVSFDIKSLFTNVQVNGALDAVKRALQQVSDNELPIRKADYIKLVSLCVNFGAFEFDGGEYRQHSGLAMGSPLSAVMASLFMEALEKDQFIDIVGRRAHWYRYVDDVLAIIPEDDDTDEILRKLNNISVKIQFTVENEEEGKLPFLDTLIRREGEGVRFSVYRKPTNRDDFIHYLSAHSERTKSGVVIGFFLRAIRICSEEYLEEEFGYIEKAFERLRYPRGMLKKLRRKALDIANRDKDRDGDPGERQYLSVPHSRTAEALNRYMDKSRFSVVSAASNRIGQLVRRKAREVNERSVVYAIPCKGCDAAYIGETGRGVKTRLQEHRRDVKTHRTSNSLVVHIDDRGHLPNWDETHILNVGSSKRIRKTVEAAHIITERNTNHREGFICLATDAAKRIVMSAARSKLRSPRSTLPEFPAG